jgi:D-alanine-D-alanine ligase-like ATP-grasp enzyme
MKRILLTTFSAAKRKLMTKKGTYELLGCDIIIDQNNRPYLLEVNTNPAMFTDTQTQKQMIPPLVSNTLDVALGLFEG